ncbi:MAG: CDP-diacylglycerol--glycerol-3-phosphate 3-phosphatidyltransferase [Proteobacteria bacterium]|nr:CDP-diacylglycerol--glycerol-3-phosphate 3-phosphatidyltransferase [Cystobacterineae bacterium]MCL2259062.1 CDP-diacylglycerol--glycerol-3-phosphate 3-phosphatidyltransferase [Cystobacterineae bacterium]MCL2314588.1 CDP-diacylglycerol--glycerol-3-phosphate 3-phosphatidyltransferase [Pseudomonadota bacterium]
MSLGAHFQNEEDRRVGENKLRVWKREFLNLPNMLTLLRMAMIPIFVVLIYGATPLFSLLAGSVFALAALTDVVDGFLARRWNMITVIGKLMDPLADKLIVAAALVMMVFLNRVPAWVVIVLLSREFLVSGLRQIAVSEGLVIAAGQEGKWKTSLQLAGIIALCVHYVHPINLLVGVYDVNFNTVGLVLVFMSMLFSLWSAAVYFRAFIVKLSESTS